MISAVPKQHSDVTPILSNEPNSDGMSEITFLRGVIFFLVMLLFCLIISTTIWEGIKWKAMIELELSRIDKHEQMVQDRVRDILDKGE